VLQIGIRACIAQWPKTRVCYIGQVKRVINTNKNRVLTIVKGEFHDKSYVVNALDPLHKNEFIGEPFTPLSS
jgi:hypothetical protein